MGGEIPPFNPCLLIMVGSIVKTIGICLTSLGSFNIPKETRNDLITTNATINISGTTGQLGGSYTYTDGADDLAVYNNKTGLITTQNMTIQWIQKEQTTFFRSNMTIDPRAEQDPTTPRKYFKNTKYLLLKITNTENTIVMPQIMAIGGNIAYSRQNYDNPLTTKSYFQVYTSYDEQMENYLTPISNAQNGYEVLTNEEQMYKLNDQIYAEKTKSYAKNSATANENIPITDVINLQKDPNRPLYVVLSWSVEANQTLDALNFNFDNFAIIMKTTDAVIEQEVIDVPGLMFDVLTMPFTFWSGAFNLTLFPGTPYQLNISSLLLALLAVAIFVFLIKKTIGR